MPPFESVVAGLPDGIAPAVGGPPEIMTLVEDGHREEAVIPVRIQVAAFPEAGVASAAEAPREAGDEGSDEG